eukprot:GEMP01005082.1.p1 GENE.GEMP01005082.1~~GEMP01005082.1.p1  ORF type:complete len:857 (+),score=146.16 GEMP01005082.1:149-2719(+)
MSFFSRPPCNKCFTFIPSHDLEGNSSNAHVCVGIDDPVNINRCNAKLRNISKSISQYNQYIEQYIAPLSDPSYGFATMALDQLRSHADAVLGLVDIPKTKEESDSLNELQVQADYFIGFLNEDQLGARMIKDIRDMLKGAVRDKVTELTQGLSQDAFVMPPAADNVVLSCKENAEEKKLRSHAAAKLASLIPQPITKPVIQPCEKIRPPQKMSPLETAHFPPLQLEEFNLQPDENKQERYMAAVDKMKTAMEAAKTNAGKQVVAGAGSSAGKNRNVVQSFPAPSPQRFFISAPSTSTTRAPRMDPVSPFVATPTGWTMGGAATPQPDMISHSLRSDFSTHSQFGASPPVPMPRASPVTVVKQVPLPQSAENYTNAPYAPAGFIPSFGVASTGKVVRCGPGARVSLSGAPLEQQVIHKIKSFKLDANHGNAKVNSKTNTRQAPITYRAQKAQMPQNVSMSAMSQTRMVTVRRTVMQDGSSYDNVVSTAQRTSAYIMAAAPPTREETVDIATVHENDPTTLQPVPHSTAQETSTRESASLTKLDEETQETQETMSTKPAVPVPPVSSTIEPTVSSQIIAKTTQCCSPAQEAAMLRQSVGSTSSFHNSIVKNDDSGSIHSASQFSSPHISNVNRCSRGLRSPYSHRSDDISMTPRTCSPIVNRMRPLAGPGVHNSSRGPMGWGAGGGSLCPKLLDDDIDVPSVQNSYRYRDLAREEQRAANSYVMNDIAQASAASEITIYPSTCSPDLTGMSSTQATSSNHPNNAFSKKHCTVTTPAHDSWEKKPSPSTLSDGMPKLSLNALLTGPHAKLKIDEIRTSPSFLEDEEDACMSTAAWHETYASNVNAQLNQMQALVHMAHI